MNEAGLVQSDAFLRKAYNRALGPCMLSILAGTLNILADGILVGQRIGVDGLAAISLCVPIYLVLCVAGSLIASGTAINASREIGEGDRDKAQMYYANAWWLGIVSAIVFTVAGVALAMPVSRALCGAEESLVRYVYEYNVVTLAGASVKIWIYLPYWFLRLDGKNKTATVMTGVMGVGNVILDIVFLYVLNMGMYGAALASVIATGAATLIGVIRQHSGRSTFAFAIKAPDAASRKMIMKTGSPAAMNNVLQAVRLILINRLLLNAGGNEMVAIFTAVNGVCAYAETITVGVPTAAAAMLGVYHGEKDNAATKILLKREVKNGVVYCIGFGIVIVLFSRQIAALYGLPDVMRFALICTAISLFPSLINNILSGFYSVSEQLILANTIIVSRVFVMAVGSLYVLTSLNLSPWPFLILGEALTLPVWYLATAVMQKKRDGLSRYLLLDERLEKDGRVINFSMVSDPEKICDASEKITGFCEENGMSMKLTMRVSLAMEEIMNLISQMNEPKEVFFDIRVFHVQGVIGIRIRDNGKLFDVTDPENADSDLFMGMEMIRKMSENLIYRNVFGMNSLVVTYEESQ